MSTKTSTAALDSRRPASSPRPCRVPRHPAGARKRTSQRSKSSLRETIPRFVIPKGVFAVRNLSFVGPVLLRRVALPSQNFSKPVSRFVRRTP